MTVVMDAISSNPLKTDPRLSSPRLDGGFGAVLKNASAADQPANVDPKLMRVAKDLVGLTMIYPVLKIAQNDPFKSELFHGGSAEETFQQQLNDRLAQRITDRVDMPLLQAIYRKLDPRSAMQARTGSKGVDRHG